MMAQMPNEITVHVLPGKSFLAVLKADLLVEEALEERPWDEHLRMLRECVQEILSDVVVR